ncbi:unnamed protein product [Urochloa humidicola]
MASPKLSSTDTAGAPVAPAPAPAPATVDRLAPWDGASFHAALAGVTVIIGTNACIHHIHDHGDAVAFLAFAYINILLLILSVRWFDHAPPGSAARRAAGLALFLLTASFIVGSVWKTTGELSLPLKAFFFFLAAAPPVAAYIYVVFVLGKDAE